MKQHLAQGLDSTLLVAPSSRTLPKSSTVDILTLYGLNASELCLFYLPILAISTSIPSYHPKITTWPPAKPRIAFPDREIESHDVTAPPSLIVQILTYLGKSTTMSAASGV